MNLGTPFMARTQPAALLMKPGIPKAQLTKVANLPGYIQPRKYPPC